MRPFENTFKLDPISCMSSSREKVELVIVQHSAAKNFDVRMASRITWKKFEKRFVVHMIPGIGEVISMPLPNFFWQTMKIN